MNGWMKAVNRARKTLGITGFVLMNQGKDGRDLYDLASEYYYGN